MDEELVRILAEADEVEHFCIMALITYAAIESGIAASSEADILSGHTQELYEKAIERLQKYRDCPLIGWIDGVISLIKKAWGDKDN